MILFMIFTRDEKKKKRENTKKRTTYTLALRIFLLFPFLVMVGNFPGVTTAYLPS